jgi:uncharacterized protein YgiM (DUF1202 family)
MGLTDMRPWLLPLAAVFGIAGGLSSAMADALPPASYTPLPVGTRLLYDDYECRVSSATGFDTICDLPDGHALYRFAGFMERGNLPGAGSSQRLNRVRTLDISALELDGSAKAALQKLWPLQVGNSTHYGFTLKYTLLGCALMPTHRESSVEATASVIGIEPVQVGSVSYDSFVIKENTGTFSSSECSMSSRLDFERTWWYAPALGAVVKSSVLWTRGDGRHTPAQSVLLRIDYPPGAAPLIAAAPPAAPPTTAPAGSAQPTIAKATPAQKPTPATQPPAVQHQAAPSTEQALQPATTAPAAPPPKIDAIDETYVALKPANVRAAPDVAAKRVAALKPGDRITVLGKVSGRDWYLVGSNDKSLGYVVASQLQSEDSYKLAQAQAAAAASQTSTTNAAPATPPAATAPTATAAASPPKAGLPPDLAKLNFGLYHALVIGNDNYRMMPSLHTAVADAKTVADTLRQVYGFDVTLLTNATRADILGALTKLRKSLGASDNLVIYYAGHGAYDQEGDQGYWLPVDAAQDDPTNWVSNADLTSSLKAMLAKHVLVVADSCYSGTLTRGLSVAVQDPEYLQRMVDQRSRTVLTSGGLEPVSDAGSAGHSVFAKAFVSALAGGGSTMDGQELFSRVREPVEANADQTPAYGIIRLAGHDGGDFVFLRK